MIYSTKYHKNTNEDPKTSTIFETLMLLPDNFFWKILRNSTRNNSNFLPEDVGSLLEYKFWPKWNPSGTTTNTNYVEPDVFFRFEKLDVIIEAKYSEENGQYFEEWEREVIAYSNEFSKEKKNVVLLAVGGNSDFKEVSSIKVQDTICSIYKYKWVDLLEQLKKIQDELLASSKENQSSLNRLISIIKEGFRIMGISEYKQRVEFSAINQINTLFKLFEDACNRKTEKYELSKHAALITTYRYLYQFHIQSINNSKKEIWLGLGIWFSNNTIAIEIDPSEGWAKPLLDDGIEEKVERNNLTYITAIYDEAGYKYTNASNKFYEDFSNSQSYDEQLLILNSFIDELLSMYM